VGGKERGRPYAGRISGSPHWSRVVTRLLNSDGGLKVRDCLSQTGDDRIRAEELARPKRVWFSPSALRHVAPASWAQPNRNQMSVEIDHWKG
jgi:hypothetical protein